MDSERFQALLSHQGPLVHVDHSHRAPAPTDEGYSWIDPRGWQENVELWRRELNVTAGQVRETVSKLKNKRFLTEVIRADGRVFHVQFSIADKWGGWKVHVIMWEGDHKDEHTAEAFTPAQDNMRLLAPELSLKPVLQKAVDMLFEAPELEELANNWSFKKFDEGLRRVGERSIKLGDASVTWQRVEPGGIIEPRNQINVVKGDTTWSCNVEDKDFDKNIVQVAKLDEQAVWDMGKIIKDFKEATIEKATLTRVLNGLLHAWSRPVQPATQGSGMVHYSLRTTPR